MPIRRIGKRGAAAKGSHRPDQRSGPQSVVSGPPEGVRSEPVDSNLRACRLIYENWPLQRSHKNPSILRIWNGLDRAVGKEYLPANSRTSTEPMVRPANASGHHHQDEYRDRETTASPAPSSELSQRGRIKSPDLVHSVPSEKSMKIGTYIRLIRHPLIRLNVWLRGPEASVTE